MTKNTNEEAKVKNLYEKLTNIERVRCLSYILSDVWERKLLTKKFLKDAIDSLERENPLKLEDFM